ncbi:hypothetical protein ILUMI_20821 [Ignelater luminosus]|uniref:Craniofacial development protein 2-like n=1 Tax=Ignelater luminosus TaxID=2038154 RepID=A0A8K0CK14_IGNLU|nr:hypothetical protein ILUMI_20821 [Ignelater luminosus]
MSFKLYGCERAIAGFPYDKAQTNKYYAERNTDIATLTETKEKKGKGKEDLANYVQFWTSVDKSCRVTAGVSDLVNKKYITNYEFKSKRIMTSTLSIYGHITTVIATYAPTDDCTQETKTNYYESLAEVVRNIPQHQELIIAGDLNARVGLKKDSETVEQFGEEVVNSSGKKLMEHCNQFVMKIINGFFKHKMIHRVTWERPSL